MVVLTNRRCHTSFHHDDIFGPRNSLDLITKNHPALLWHPGRHERPAAATGSQALWFLHNSPHYERFMQQPPVLQGYDLSSEMDPKRHTTIIAPTREVRIFLLIRQVLIRCPPVSQDRGNQTKSITVQQRGIRNNYQMTCRAKPARERNLSD
ncbi:hypothetical protein AVEN_116834-1 [Araneus ventricosus]|uniref:Uncharacterized protein n=1 Tax=Araneus ventricosus TaxID=182803 RepID=A0A4Y2G674_ARAVE|nr:hypothetical protein AVEN_116834-1 [Araneus ventricosus]